jgi:hypothetical protein
MSSSSKPMACGKAGCGAREGICLTTSDCRRLDFPVRCAYINYSIEGADTIINISCVTLQARGGSCAEFPYRPVSCSLRRS